MTAAALSENSLAPTDKRRLCLAMDTGNHGRASWTRPHFVILLLLLLVTRFIHADTDVPNGCKPVVSADRDWHVIIVRPHEDAFLSCTLTQAQLRDLVTAFLKTPENRQEEFTSLFLGRLVDHPWLSRYLATHALTDARWDKVKGRPGSGYNNGLVRDILSAPEVLNQIQESFAGSGYTVVGASVEKVLVTRANEISWLRIDEPVLVPYDALTHFILKKMVPR